MFFFFSLLYSVLLDFSFGLCSIEVQFRFLFILIFVFFSLLYLPFSSRLVFSTWRERENRVERMTPFPGKSSKGLVYHVEPDDDTRHDGVAARVRLGNCQRCSRSKEGVMCMAEDVPCRALRVCACDCFSLVCALVLACAYVSTCVSISKVIRRGSSLGNARINLFAKGEKLGKRGVPKIYP